MTTEQAITKITASIDNVRVLFLTAQYNVRVLFLTAQCGHVMTPQGQCDENTVLFPFGENHPDDGKDYPSFAELAAKWDAIMILKGRTFEWHDSGMLCVSPYRYEGMKRVYIPFKDL